LRPLDDPCLMLIPQIHHFFYWSFTFLLDHYLLIKYGTTKSKLFLHPMYYLYVRLAFLCKWTYTNDQKETNSIPKVIVCVYLTVISSLRHVHTQLYSDWELTVKQRIAVPLFPGWSFVIIIGGHTHIITPVFLCFSMVILTFVVHWLTRIGVFHHRC